MGIYVDRRVHVPDGFPAVTDDGLPPLAMSVYSASAADRLGECVRTALTAPACVRSMWRVHQRQPLASSLARSNGAGVLRMMEYNVHGGMGGPGEYLATPASLDRLANAIATQNPDVVLLQELDRFALRSNFTNTIAALTQRLRPDSAVMTPGIEKVNGRLEGTGILTFHGNRICAARGLRIDDAFGDGFARRFRAVVNSYSAVAARRIGRSWHPRQAPQEYQPRVVTDAMMHTPDGIQIRLMSGHFSSPRPGCNEFDRQVRPVVNTILANVPTVLGADFNTCGGSNEYAAEHRIFAQAGMVDATAQAPDSSDRIYASAHFAATEPRRIATPAGEDPASDHAPILVELSLRDTGGQ